MRQIALIIKTENKKLFFFAEDLIKGHDILFPENYSWFIFVYLVKQKGERK